MEVLRDRVYTEEHEWARYDEEGLVWIGITAYAQDQLGDVVYVELPEPGTILDKEETFGVVESTKTVSDLYAPISGRIVRVNSDLVDAPGTLNEDPYENGWILVIEPSELAELDELLDAEAYAEFCGS